jgi:hypothetical protein
MLKILSSLGVDPGRAFKLTTHAASGLTRSDFVLAAKIDQLTRA